MLERTLRILSVHLGSEADTNDPACPDTCKNDAHTYEQFASDDSTKDACHVIVPLNDVDIDMLVAFQACRDSHQDIAEQCLAQVHAQCSGSSSQDGK